MSHIDLTLGYEPEEATSYYVEYWYDRHQRLWIVEVFDNLDRPVACTPIPKYGLDSVLKDYADEYATTDIRKV